MEESLQNPGSSSSSSAEIVGSINDLLQQILVKLPIKSLLRFKSVCKPWLSLITNPSFFPNPNPHRGIFFGDKSRFQFIPLSPNTNPFAYGSLPINRHFTRNDTILQACNGLMLCFGKGNNYYVYNPTTYCSTVLPLDYRFYDRYVTGASIAFDPRISQRFKVVYLLDARTYPPRTSQHYEDVKGTKKSKFIFRIYSSETNKWSKRGERASPLVHSLLNRFHAGVYWKGCIHWLPKHIQGTALRLHVDTLLLSEMPSPPHNQIVAKPGGDFYVNPCYFGESCDHLHYAECTLPQFNIYEMATDYSEWFVKYKVDLSNMIARYPEVERIRKYVTYILSIVRGKNDDSDSHLVLRTPRKAIKFNLVDGSLEDLCDFNEGIPSDYYALGMEEYGRIFIHFVDGYAMDYVPCLL